MTRLSLKIDRRDGRATANRFERFSREAESHTDTLARLLDEAGVPETLRCSECGETVQTHVRDESGVIFCPDCGLPDRG